MFKEIKENILNFEFENIIGNKDVKKQIKSAIYARRPIIIVGPPGIGKTTIAKELIKIIPIKEVNDCNYNCLPDSPACPQCIIKNKNNEKIKNKTDKS